MDPITAGILVGGSLLGAAGNLISGSQNRRAQANANRQNYEAQKEFYQNSVSWRVADSKRAGVNPIYGLGADSANFSPSFQAVGNNGAGDALNSVSQGAIALAQIQAQSAMMRAQTKMYDAEARFKDAQIDALKHTSTSSASSVLDPTNSNGLTPSSNVVKNNNAVKKQADGDFADGMVKLNNHYAYKDMKNGTFEVVSTSQTKRDNETESIGAIGAIMHGLGANVFPTGSKIQLPDGRVVKFDTLKTIFNKSYSYTDGKTTAQEIWEGINQFLNKYTHNPVDYMTKGAWRVYKFLKDTF